MAIKTVPSLTTDGFLTHIPTMIVKIYEYFTISDYSQSVCFFGNISSLTYIVNTYSTKPDMVRLELMNTLTKLYNNYWDNIDIDVEIKSFINDVYDINVDVSVTDSDGNVHSLRRNLVLDVKSFLNNSINLEFIKGNT